jgi:hypothetical protein
MEALEELNALLPALEAYAADSHVADVIKYTKTKIAQAEANIPQAKVKFEAEPLKDQVNKTQQLLDVCSLPPPLPCRVGLTGLFASNTLHIPEIHQGLVLPRVLQHCR